MEDKYTSTRLIDGKPRKIIVDEHIINKNPNKEELKGLEKEEYRRYNKYENKDYLLRCLRQFYEETGRVPKKRDFENNPKYPGYRTFNCFGMMH